MKSVATLLAATLGAILLAVLMLLGVNLECSQEWRPNEGQQSAEQNQKTTSGQSGDAAHKTFSALDEFNAIVNPNKPENSANDHKGGKRNWWHAFVCEVKATDLALAFFTLMLVIVGAFQAYWLRRTIDATKEIGQAALSVEHPIIFVQEIELSEWVGHGKVGSVLAGGCPPAKTQVAITFHNVGRSAAILTRICLEYGAVWELPQKPIYANIRTIPASRIIRRDESLLISNIGEVMTISEEERSRIMERELPLAHFWLYGYAAFNDVRGKEHVTGFCYRWHASQVALEIGERRGFHGDGPPAYTYNT
jgi:hypothetical protein